MRLTGVVLVDSIRRELNVLETQKNGRKVAHPTGMTLTLNISKMAADTAIVTMEGE